MNKYEIKIGKTNIKIVSGIFGIWIFFLLSACSTTKNLPEGEVLYTGIKKIEVAGLNHTKAEDNAIEEIESALSYPPNNALFGSSSERYPFPVGLWIYNAFVNKKGKINKWIFNTFAAKPVFISAVNPEVRAAIARNLLRENGYFDGTSTYEIIPEKNLKKAKVSYKLEMNHAYTYDSIQYMRMRHYADTLIKANDDKRLLHKDDNFNVVKLEAERQRISTLLRNNGFYYFRPDFIVYDADTLLSPGKVWLRVQRKDGLPPNVLRPFRIGDISVHIRGFDTGLPVDSVTYKELTIYYQGKLRIHPRILYGRFTFKPGDLYRQEEQQRTQTGISRLEAFSYTEFQYSQRDTAIRSWNDLLDMRVNTAYDLPYDGEFEVNITTKSNDYTGPGAIFGLTRRNAFRGGELIGLQLHGSYEWQTGTRTEESSKINSYELGLSSTLTFPFILLPGFIYRDLVQPSTTTFRLSADLMNRAKFFKMISFGGSMAYEFRPTSTTKHSITPFRLTYNKINPTQLFDSIADANKSLYLSLQDQLIPAMSYTFTYDNTAVSNRNQLWWETTLTQSGNILNGMYAIAGKDFNKRDKEIFGNRFSQFIQGTSEVRYNYQIDRNNHLVGRLGLGAIYSYGNALLAPYSEQFYVGGANNIRAFTIRSIGPGRYVAPLRPDGTVNPYAYIDRTGDLKFEANLEYRFKIVGDLNGAVFFDSGGIWTIRKDDGRPGGQLKMDKFFNDLATGTGIGLRYDLSFLVARFDFGLALHVPYETDKRGYFNINPFKHKSGRAWHLAIGYPF
ncbi:MAG: BamA/TamA family outer membrane protein [Tannerellaceae bacterium]|jgi:outer membrane protein assembly factor BamA|nr:BamA/TamA family outer membrane protein [Tannerellaceae bacterium]